jgi:hypothetical protein
MKKLVVLLSITGLVITSYASINQLIKTSLTLIIRDEAGNTVEKATVKLYEKEDDYLKEVNPAAEGETDEKGAVRFKNLKAIPYFVIARKGDKDNSGGGEQTGRLEEKKFNKATIIIQ